jgi:hypothetical protein
MDSQHRDSTKEDATINLPDLSIMESTFFRLPSIVRHKIYRYVLHPRGITTFTIEPPAVFKSMTSLLGISQRIRSEVYHLVASDAKARIRAGLYNDLTLEPITVAKSSKSQQKKKSSNNTNILSKAPHVIKFWNIRLVVLNASEEIRVTADIDFKSMIAKLDFPDDQIFDMFSSNYADYVYEMFEEGFTKGMKAVAERDGFDGFMLKDVALLLHNVDMPCPKYWWEGDELFGHDEESDCSEEYEEYLVEGDHDLGDDDDGLDEGLAHGESDEGDEGDKSDDNNQNSSK